MEGWNQFFKASPAAFLENNIVTAQTIRLEAVKCLICENKPTACTCN